MQPGLEGGQVVVTLSVTQWCSKLGGEWEGPGLSYSDEPGLPPALFAFQGRLVPILKRWGGRVQRELIL